MIERQIIDGCLSGDSSARRELYERYSKLMYGVCCRYIKDREMARDLLHDGFITIFTKISEYRGEGSFEGWCRRIFVTTALGYLRKKNPLNESDDLQTQYALSGNESSAIEKMSADELLSTIGKLPEGYRTILNLYAVDGYSHKEVAEIMGISENTSRSQYSRARAKLADMLANKELIKTTR